MQGEMERLENDIALLSRAIIFPETPSLTARVRSRIQTESPARDAAPRWQLALTGVAAAAVALAFLAGVIAPARDAVADIFDRINIFETDEVPQDLTREITGTPLSFEEVQNAVGFPLRLPDGARPNSALLQDFGQVKAAVLFYKHNNGAVYALFETNTQVGKGISTGKGVTDPGQARPVTGLGSEAYWLTGLRITQYQEIDGAVIQQSTRATEVNTLLWSQDGRVFRIEGDLSREEAIAVANSLQ